MSELKPIKSGCDFIRDADMNPILFSEKAALAYVKKIINYNNRKLKRTGSKYRGKLEGNKVVDRGGYFTYSVS